MPELRVHPGVEAGVGCPCLAQCFGLCSVCETMTWQNTFGKPANGPSLAAAWIWGWLDKLPPLHFSRHLSKSIFLSLFLSGNVLWGYAFSSFSATCSNL